MKLIAILALIATFFVIVTEAQQSTLKPVTTKSTTPKPTTPKPTTKPTTPKATTKPTTPKPTTKPTTPKPTTKPTTPKQTTPKPTTIKPNTPKPTTPKPSTPKPTTPKPTTTKPATLKPATPTTTLKPTEKTTLKPTVTTTFKSTSTIKSTVTNLIVTTTPTQNLTTTLKTTVLQTTTTTPAPKTTAKSNVTASTATPKQNVTTTTVKQSVSTSTLKPTAIGKYFVCRDTNSTAATGSIELDRNSTNSLCSFDIVAPRDQQIQIFCSSLNFPGTPSSNLIINGDLDNGNDQLVLNRMYYSANNSLSLVYSKMSNGDSFNCNWTTAPKEITANSKLCRHAQASTASGTIQPSASDGGPPRTCFFSINVLPSQRIQISCSAVKLTVETETSFLSIEGVTEIHKPYQGPVLNRVYYSVDNNVYLRSQVDIRTWFNCSWTTIPRENTTNSQLCLHGLASTANGTIQPMTGLTVEPRECRFYIRATSNNQIQISCSGISLPFSGNYISYLSINGVTDNYIDTPISNRVYYSTSANYITVSSQVSSLDSFTCKWATIPKENTTNSKLCRHTVATTESGTIQPLTGDVEPPRDCSFFINAAYNKEIQISCSSVNIVNPDSYLLISGSNEYSNPPVLNRVYTSNQIIVTSQIGNGDSFTCTWTTIPLQNTTDAKLCRNGWASTANGTLQPIAGDTGPLRLCSFFVNASYDQQVQMSCSDISLVDPNSNLRISGTLDNGNPPVLNRVYTSTAANLITVSSQISNTDWFNCNWSTTPKKNTADNKLCFNRNATTLNGTIEPFVGDTGSPRQCSFSILSSFDQQIQISCSTVNLADSSNYFRINGVIDSADPPIVNRLYTSNTNTRIDIKSKLGNGDWARCNFTTTPKDITNNYNLCRQTEATTANGTIRPLSGDTGPERNCPFSIYATDGQEIQISCSVISLTGASSSLFIFGSLDGESIQPVVNRVYYSSSSNYIFLNSNLGSGDGLNCKWITVPRMNTSDSKLCRHEFATTANGTIMPLTGDTGPPRQCSFVINNADSSKQIQISCSVVNLNSASSSLSIGGTIDSSVNPPLVNRVYASAFYISLQAEIDNGDTFTCKWTTIPKKNSSNSKLCLDEKATTANGNLQPIAGDVGPARRCRFEIDAGVDKQIQISCSAVSLTGDTSYLRISGAIDSANPPVVNRVYTSTAYNTFYIDSRLGSGDWINCNWTITPKENTTNNKLCRHQSTTSKSGTIQPIGSDTGPSRECGFSINVYSSIQISCSVVNLVNSDSYLQFMSNSDNGDPVNPPMVNTVYTYQYGDIQLTSKVGDGDWFDCKWKPTP